MARTDDHVSVTVRLPVELADRLRRVARSRTMGRNLLVELLLADGLDRLEPPEAIIASEEGSPP